MIWLFFSLSVQAQVYQNPILHLDASLADGNDGLNSITSSRWSMNGGCTVQAHNNVQVFDLQSACFLQSDETIPYCGSTFGYTIATWIDFGDSNSGFRTLHRTTWDHPELVEATSNELGVYLLAGIGWVSSGYSVNTTGWQLVVTVGQDTSCINDGGVGGTTTFYIGTPSGEPTLVGTVNYAAATGESTYRIGTNGQGPGQIALTSAWNWAFNSLQVTELWQTTVGRFNPASPLTPPSMPIAPPHVPPSPLPPYNGAIIEMTGDAPKIVFGTLESPICELTLDRSLGSLRSSCDINTNPSLTGRRLSSGSSPSYDELKLEIATLKVDLANLRDIVQSHSSGA